MEKRSYELYENEDDITKYPWTDYLSIDLSSTQKTFLLDNFWSNVTVNLASLCHSPIKDAQLYTWHLNNLHHFIANIY